MDIENKIKEISRWAKNSLKSGHTMNDVEFEQLKAEIKATYSLYTDLQRIYRQQTGNKLEWFR